MIVIRTQAQFDQGAGIRHRFILPAVIGLELAQGGLGRSVPLVRRLAFQITLLDQSLLNLMSSLAVNLLLPALFGMLALARSRRLRALRLG